MPCDGERHKKNSRPSEGNNKKEDTHARRKTALAKQPGLTTEHESAPPILGLDLAGVTSPSHDRKCYRTWTETSSDDIHPNWPSSARAPAISDAQEDSGLGENAGVAGSGDEDLEDVVVAAPSAAAATSSATSTDALSARSLAASW